MMCYVDRQTYIHTTNEDHAVRRRDRRIARGSLLYDFVHRYQVTTAFVVRIRGNSDGFDHRTGPAISPVASYNARGAPAGDPVFAAIIKSSR